VQEARPPKADRTVVNEKAFRLDFVIAIAALLVSAITSITLLYQTRVISDQYAATIWPYLSVDSSYGVHGVTIDVANDGLGPALIESAQLLIDGEPTPSWGTYMHDLLTAPGLKPKPGDVLISSSSFGRSTTIRPGDTKLLFAITYKPTIDPRAFTAHSVGIRLCYCSINSSCWEIAATPGRDSRTVPQSVSGCAENTAISSDLTFQLGKSRRHSP
jgi:hypothetical protein